MNEWKEYKLGEIVDINKSSINKDYPYNEIEYLDTGSITQGKIEGFQYYKIEDAPSRAKRLVEKNDIIYSTVRPIQRHYGYFTNFNKNLVVSTGFAVISTKDNVNSKFLYYFLTSDETVNYLDMIAEASTSAYPSLRPDDIAKVDILLPPLPEQRTIASILSSLDDKIDLLHRQNKTLEQLAETVFRQYFIENTENENDELPLDKIADFLNGLPCQKYPPKDSINVLPVIKIKELRTGITDASDLATSKVPENYLINEGDIIFSWSGSLDVVIWAYGKGVLNQHLFKVTSKIYPKWLYYFTIKHFMEEFRSIAEDKATTMGHIQRHHLSDAILKIPKNWKKLNNTLSPFLDKIVLNNKQIYSLQMLRDTLLPKLMSGEVRVKI